MKKSAVASLAVYSALHFLIDFTCAMVMFSRVRGGDGWAVCLLLYNFFAFAMQLPFGILADRLDRNAFVAAAGCVLVAVSGFLTGAPPAAACVAGIGNGLFHVGGGLDALNGRNGRCAPAGIFVSPGAAGLFLGTRLGMQGVFSPIPAAILLAAAPAVILLFRGDRGGGRNPDFDLPSRRAAAPAAGAAVLLLAVVCVRGLAGMLFTFEWKPAYAAVLVAAVVLGKTAGGFAADWLGSRLTALISLAAAAVLFLFSSVPAAGIAAVFLFNMTMPLTLTAAADVFSHARGLSFGLMTFGLFLGFLPVFFGLASASVRLYAGLSALSLALILPGLALAARASRR